MKEPNATAEKRLHQAFEIGVILKGLNALLEIVLGSALLFFNVGGIINALIDNALIDDPTDFIATHLEPFAERLTPGVELFSALYLLSHGVVKVFLVAGLLRDKRWAYPASLAVLALFITYQVIKILQNHSIMLVLLTIFDLALMWLIWHEYKHKHYDNP